MDCRRDTGRVSLEEILLLIVLINRVEIVASLTIVAQSIEVEAFTGENVLLRCVRTDELQDPVSFYWRDKDQIHVLDIMIDGPNRSKAAKKNQFSGRVTSFYTKGNFSIVINNVTMKDNGTYKCHVEFKKYFYEQTVTLLLTDKPIARFEGTEASLLPTPAGGAADTHTSLCPTLLCLLWACV